MLQPKISVLLLTQNSQRTLKRCLDSLKAFDEVVLIDGGSTDKTLEIARRYKNVNIYQNSWPGFIAQRNFSISCARYPWCFMMDSDEVANPALVETLYQTICQPSPKVLYRVMRTEYYLGKAIEIGHGKSSYQERLFQTTRVHYTGGNHHQHLIDGQPLKKKKSLVDDLPHHIRIDHDVDYDLQHWIKKLPRFAILVGEEKHKQGQVCHLLPLLLTPLLIFFKTYLRHWLNGRIGFIISVQEALYHTLVNLVLYEKQSTHFRPKTSSITDYLN